jgi:hypothetical protein
MKLRTLSFVILLLMSSKFAVAWESDAIEMATIATPAGVAQFLNANPKCQDALMREGSIKSAILSGAGVIAISGTIKKTSNLARGFAGMPRANYEVFKLAVRVGTSSGDLYGSPIEVTCESEFSNR